jgi:ankyrin repeat protein
VRDEAGLSVFDQAAISGTLSQLPKKQLTMKSLTFRNEDTWKTPLHWAAKFGHLDQVPENVLTDRTILTEDRDAERPLHIAAENGFLNQFPERLLHQGNMLCRGGDGTCPFDRACFSKHLDQMPLRVICACRDEVRDLYPENFLRDIDAAIALRAMQEPPRSLDEL